MNRWEIEKRRNATKHLGVGAKFLLKNFGAIFSAYFRYIFPLVLLAPAVMVFIMRSYLSQDSGLLWQDFSQNTLYSIILKIAAHTISMLSAIILAGAMKAYIDKGYQNINASELTVALKTMWKRQLSVYSIFFIGILLSTVALYYIWSVDTSLGILFLIVMIGLVVFFLMRYGLLYYAIAIENESVGKANTRVARYRVNNIASILGVVVVGYYASYGINFMLSLPSDIASMFFGILTLTDLSGQANQSFNWLQIAAMFYDTFTTSFAYLFFYSFLLLKYFDVKERTDDLALREKIAMIGEERELFFENEGEY